MTKIIGYRSNNKWSGYLVEGHSGYGEEGSDIICATISVLTWQVYQSIVSLTKDRPQLIEDEKEAYIQCILDNVSTESQLLLESYFLTVNHLTEVYPEYISLKIEEVE